MELNKIAASILLSGLIIMIVSNVVDMLYNPEDYKIEHQTIVAASNEPQQKIEQVALDIGELMQNASFEKGKSAAKKCIACHSFEKGGMNKVGPNLWNVVENKKAHLHSSFNYSKALLEKGGKWGYEELFTFLKNPKAYIKGTRMAFAGISNPQEIADLVSYLRSMSDSPVALPK
ncbi:Cytochrome c family protein [Wolbachia endosymbiont of Drosophila simulans wNo]|uniref:c-type cytochrome n=1 Tax=unclassified Wolbachia TaxID=2640676 RepID=UPI0002D24CC2|nr:MULTISPECIES: cytochrome c family protein [unclassified Wolbachia]AGJ99091.1 Cytochrome c family protein [Wolbachia endosymbiont of Drosophila simulans wNo]QCB62459.1 cytochrome c family protein [Wolbachia endosymbiont of Drosophila mauritiana]QCB63506.1 cytochrome c family protein [Wolbachia endosymbiont of Drosophila mauritiana]QWE33224.1 Cytochrome c family protein [Wolbachia endosymbiont of Drosophila simulans]TGB07209.1 cytochrome c family protein [Wolbachia endosymbiont of Drosophila 